MSSNETQTRHGSLAAMTTSSGWRCRAVMLAAHWGRWW